MFVLRPSLMRRSLLVTFIILCSFTGLGQIIFTQNFEAAWTTPGTLSPAWSGTAAPADNQWHRDDYTTGWTSSTGSYTPAGANSTLHSARFHSYDAANGTTGDFISPVIDLSPYTAGVLMVKFYYINPTGADILNIYSSNDGGTTWSAALRAALGVSAAWTEYTVTLPGNSATTRIKFTATSDYGNDDIGVDEFRVLNPVIPAPPVSFTASSVTSYGMTIGWTDNSTNETGFRVYRSPDGITYTQSGTDITSTSVATTGTLYSQVQTGLTPGTTYFYRIVSFADAESAYLTGSQATLAPPPPIHGVRTIPSANYLSFTVACDSIANKGIGPGGIIFNVDPAYTETTTGLLLTSNPTYPSTAANPITFQKNGAGADPLISRTDAGTLATSTLGGQGDAVFIIQGADYITFDGIDLSSTNSGIEYGYYLRKASPTDGCKNVTIKNCAITMTKGASAYVAGIYASNNDASSAVSSSAGITLTSTGGRHENVTLTGNTISNVFSGILLIGYSGAASPYDMYDQNFVVGSTGSGNIIQNFAGNTASAAYGVYIAYHTNPAISYNIIDNAGGGGVNATSTLYGIYMGTSSLPGNFIANYNTITLGQASTATLSSIYISPTCATVTVNNNTLNVGTFASTTTSYLISCSNGTPNITINGNQTGTFTKSGVASLYGYYNNGSPTGGTFTFNGNNFSNITLTGASAFYAIQQTTSTTQAFVITNNTISNITGGSSGLYGIYAGYGAAGSTVNGNTISGWTGTGSMYGLYLGATTAPLSLTAYNNSVSGLNTTGAATVYGIYNSLGTLNSIYKNKVYNLQANNASGVVYGIYIGGGTTTYVYNNFLSDLRTPSANAAIPLAGIYVSSGTTNYLFYNTIYLNATSSGALFGSAAVYASTTPTVDMRNNILVNVSTYKGTGITAAYRRSSTTLTSYANIADNNLLYAGTASANNLLYYDGTNSDQTLATYKTRVSPRDVHSVMENPPFINVAATPYDLHISPSVATQCESGAFPVTSPLAVTVDYDDNARSATFPDIGADEFAGIMSDLTSPYIVYTPLNNTASTSARTLIATITDPSGVPVTGIGLPVLYWKIGAGAYSAATATSLGGGQYQFSFGAGVVVTNVVSYYICAQDNVPTPNVGASPVAGTSGYTPNPPASATPPTTPSSYTIMSGLSGTKTVGTGGDYINLTGATGAFLAINSSILTGNLTLSIISNLTEDGTNALNQWMEDGAGGYTVTIQPNSTTERLVSGAVANGMIRLNGADRTVIDGRSGGSGRYLRFRNTNTSNPVFILINDATNNIIRSSYIESPTTATSGIILFSTTTGTTGNDNNTITDNVIRDRTDATGVPLNGIISVGTSGMDNSSNTISNNEIANFSSYGIYLITGSGDSWTVSGNSFYSSLATPPSTSQYAIYFGQGSSSVNNVISGNFIGGQSANCGGGYWVNSGAISFYGIYLYSSTQTTSVQNNTIQNISLTNTGPATFRGIYAYMGTIDIGSVTGNLIGSLSTPASILIAGTGVPAGIQGYTTCTIAKNTIANMAISNSSAAPNCYGIYLYGNYQMNVYGNKIYNIGPTSAAANAVNNYPTAGIMLYGPPASPNTYNVYNNLVLLGGDGYSHNISLLGFWFYCTSGNSVVDHNSVYISGTYAAANTRYSIAFEKQGTGIVETKDNIFSNFRLNGAGGTGFNMAYFAVDMTNLTSDYNDLYTIDPTTVGAWNSFVYDFPNYKLASGMETNSISTDPLFISSTDLHPQQPLLVAGTTVPLVTTDYSGITRKNPPTMGAYEMPQVTTVAASPIGQTGATLNATVNACGMSMSTSFEYGLTIAYGNTAAGSPSTVTGTSSTAVSSALAGLTINTIYHFRAKGVVGANTYYGADMTFDLVPSPSIISGPTQVCVGSTGNVYVTQAGKAGYVWTVSAGGTINSGQGTNSISVTWGSAGAQTVNVNYQNTTGTYAPSPAVYNVTVDPASVGGSIAGGTSVCTGTNSTLLTLSGYTGTITKWQYSTDNWATSTDIANTASTYTATNVAITTKYRAVVTNGSCAPSNSTDATVTVTPASIGGSIAGSASVCTGINSTLLTLSGYTGSITKWQWSTDNWATSTDIANTTAIYTATNLVMTTKYRVVVTSGICTPANSTDATITVSPASVGGSISGSATVCAGTNSTLLTLSGYTGSITKWQFSIDNWATSSDIANTIATYTATNLSVTTRYRAVITSGVCSPANSTDATVTVTPGSVGGSIAGSATVCTGTNSTLLTLSGYTGSITKWQYSTDNWATSTDIVNITATYTATNLAATTKFRVVVTNGSCSPANSTDATVTVNPASAGGSIAGSATVCAGTNSTLLTLSGYTGSITKWQFSIDNWATSTDIANTIATYTATNLSVTTRYRAVITSGVCSPANSTDATVTVTPGSVGGSIAGSATVCSGTNSTLLTLSAYTGSITKWQYSTDNWVTSTDIANTTVTYTATNLSVTTRYRAVVTNGICSPANSTDATVTVTPASAGGSIAGSATVCTGTNSTLLTLSSYTGSITKWQYSTDNWLTSTDIANTTATYTAINLILTTKYRAVVTSGICSPANSTDATITVAPASVGGSVAGSATVCSGINSTLLTLSGYTGSITKWQYSINNWVTSTDIANTTATYTATNLVATTKYRAVVTAGTCAPANSSDATVTVTPGSVGGSITGSATVCSGTNSTLLTLSGYTGSITKWQYSTDNWLTSTDIANTTATYTATNLILTTKYRAVVTNGICTPANSTDATVTVTPASVGGSIAGSATVCSGTNSTMLTLSGYTGSITKWQYSINNWATSTDIANTTASYTATNLVITTKYRAVITSGICTPANSSDATVTVTAGSVGGSISGSATVCAGTNSTLLTLSAYTGSITKWQYSTDSWATSTDIPNTLAFYTATNLSVTTAYRAVVTAGSCSPANSSPATVTVSPTPVPTVSGPTTCYPGSSGNIYTTETGMSGYSWTISAGGIINSGSGTNSISVTWNTAGAQYVTITYTNGSGCSPVSPFTYNVTVSDIPGPAGPITGVPTVCQQQAGVAYSVAAVFNATGYVWTLPAGASISTGLNTRSVTVDFSAGAVSGNITVYGTNALGNGNTSPPFTVTVNPSSYISLTSCNDPYTTTSSKPIVLAGGIPPGGQYYLDGNLVSGGILNPATLAVGIHQLVYKYTSYNTCVSTSVSIPLTVITGSNLATCPATFTDPRDNTIYHASFMGSHCWMLDNLSYGNVLNPTAQHQKDNCVPEKYCPPADPSCTLNGGLYQWNELMQYLDPSSGSNQHGLCPPEWHVPTDAEWQLLVNGQAHPGNGEAGWDLKDQGAVNGFKALLGGVQYQNFVWAFNNGNPDATLFWTSTQNGLWKVVTRGLNSADQSVSKYYSLKNNAFPVRCVKD
jgi:uncharacterized protein (TIGR02145 family)